MEKLDWTSLGFKPRHTATVIFSRFKDGEWSQPQSTGDFSFTLDPYAGVFHYATSCFEGLKAFRGVDGKVRIFRPDQNAARLADAATFLGMPAPP